VTPSSQPSATTTDSESPPRFPVWLLAGLWTLPALLSTFETVVFNAMNGRPVPVWRAFVSEASGWYTWALITPLVIQLSRRLPVRRGLRVRHIPIHLAAAIAAGALQATVSAAVGGVLATSSRPFLTMTWSWFLSQLPFTVIIYVAIVGVSDALLARRRAEQRERQAERLAKELAEAQLGALRMQLQPHFLFNTLNAIMALVRDVETERAIQALSLLSDVLRTTMRAGAENETTLAEEVAFVSRYLEIERVRFGDRLAVSIDVSPSLGDALVPSFVLQPFVENALRHGLARRRDVGHLEVTAAEENGHVRIVVSDDGAGLSPDWEDRTTSGVGIANSRARLAALYGSTASVAVAPGPAGQGTRVTIDVPRHFR
jgi:two-component system, LytTR family, sensor kinase